MNHTRNPGKYSTQKPTKKRAFSYTKPQEEAAEATFPMRINKYLAHKNYSTRRGADEMVREGKVFINGKRGKIGATVTEKDVVEVKRSGKLPTYTYIAFNKPVGMNSHAEDAVKSREKDIMSALPTKLRQLKLFPLGRLDKDSHGLILLTDDGRITDRLLNPKYEHEKTYEVKTKDPLRPNFKANMEKGVTVDRLKTKPCKVTILGENKFNVTLTEGKTHQIRRMVSALLNDVTDLKRVRIMNIELGTLKAGENRVLEGTERDIFLKSLGV